MKNKDKKDKDSESIFFTIPAVLRSVSKLLYCLSNPDVMYKIYARPYVIIITPILIVSYFGLLLLLVHTKKFWYAQLFIDIGYVCLVICIITFAVFQFMDWRRESKKLKKELNEYLDNPLPKYPPLSKKCSAYFIFCEISDSARIKVLRKQAKDYKEALGQLSKERPEDYKLAMEYLELNTKDFPEVKEPPNDAKA